MSKRIDINGYVLVVLLVITGALVYAAWPTLVIVAPWLTGAVLAGAAGYGLVRGAVWLYEQRARISESQRTVHVNRNTAGLSDLEVQQAVFRLQSEMQLVLAQMQQLSAGLVYAEQLGNGVFRSHTTGAAKLAAQAMPPIEQPAAMPDLLQTLLNPEIKNILIIGGKGRGKTSLMQWLAAERAKRETALIFDSHSHPAKWPAGKVVGNKRNYELIWGYMLKLVEELDNRYVDFGEGKKLTGQFAPIGNFIDELTLLPRKIKDIGGDIQTYNHPILTEGRKVDLNVVWAVHSDRVDALGLKGAADLKECFDAQVYLKKVQGDYYALIDWGEGIDKTTRYRHPGPFVVNGQASDVPPAIEQGYVVDLPRQPKSDVETRADRIRELYARGLNKTEIARELGYSSNSGAIFYEIKDALGE